MKTENSSPDRPAVDGIYVINMERRPDRWEAFQVVWRDLLPWDRVVRFSASEGVQLPGFGEKPWFRGRKRDRTWAGRAGCALSHARALRDARSRGWSRVLILEDDALPAVPGIALPPVLANEEWDLLYLGGQEPEGPFSERLPGTIGIHGALETHAYAVNATARDWLIERLPTEPTVWAWVARERAIDRWMRREVGRDLRVEMCWPQFAVQADDVSDITMRRESIGAAGSGLAADHPHRNASEARRAVEIVVDRTRAGFKRLIGF